MIVKLTQTLQQQGLLDITEDEVKEFAAVFLNTSHFSLDISWLFGDYYHQDMPDILRTTETNKLSADLCECLRVLIHISRRRLGISQKYLQRANHHQSQICPNCTDRYRIQSYCGDVSTLCLTYVQAQWEQEENVVIEEETLKVANRFYDPNSSNYLINTPSFRYPRRIYPV